MSADIPTTMRAWVLERPGGPEALIRKELPVPSPQPGRVLIKIRAFGLNRSEWFTRRGDSPTVKLPRVLGIECVGQVAADPDGLLEPGQTVAALMGGMGRQYDGGYAEFTSVPRQHVFPLETNLPWERLGALPEMLQTTNGSLQVGLEAKAGELLLIRGGTSSIGLATLALAKANGLRVASTTRSERKRPFLEDRGAEWVFVEDGALASKVREQFPDGVDRLLELVGTTTLLDSLRCVRRGGVVCMTGILGGGWELAHFRPMGDIPTGVRLTSYSGGSGDISPEQMQRYVTQVEIGELRIPVGPVLAFDQLGEAHQRMDDNSAGGKMVILLDRS
jgi:NADPH:quinone reductase-like Zn-dependent oxidoreductase